MSAPPRSALKSLPVTPEQPVAAGQAAAPKSVGRPESVGRKAVPTARRPEQQEVVAKLRIVAPPERNATPSARSWCRCGRDRSATGRAAVLQLVLDHTEHRDACPLRNPSTGRTAA